MKNAYQPIYPSEFSKVDSIGLTKREYFAAMAMQGLIAADGAICSDNATKTKMWPPSQVAESAVQYADALLAELEKS